MPCCATWNLLKNELWNKTPLISKRQTFWNKKCSQLAYATILCECCTHAQTHPGCDSDGEDEKDEK